MFNVVFAYLVRCAFCGLSHVIVTVTDTSVQSIGMTTWVADYTMETTREQPTTTAEHSPTTGMELSQCHMHYICIIVQRKISSPQKSNITMSNIYQCNNLLQYNRKSFASRSHTHALAYLSIIRLFWHPY